MELLTIDDDLPGSVMTDDYDPAADAYCSWLEAIAELRRRYEEEKQPEDSEG